MESTTMTLTATDYKYVELDENNVPFIAGTTMKVVELITSHIVYGWSPEELHFQYPHVALSKFTLCCLTIGITKKRSKRICKLA
jgi:uncharacterized protein (DUF433 family)